MFFKNNVTDEVHHLNKEIAVLESRIQDKQALIQELKNQLYDQKEKSKYVNEALNDALNLSEKITNEASLKAKLMLKTHEEQIENLENEFDLELQRLSQLETYIIEKENRLKQELKHFVQVLSDKLDKFDTGAIESIVSKLDLDFTQAINGLEQAESLSKISPQILAEDEADEVPVFYLPKH